MVVFKNVKATVVRLDDKKPYPEFIPEQDDVGGHFKRKVIYVGVDQAGRFAVVLKIMPQFNFKGHWTICANDVTNTKSDLAIDARQVIWDEDERLIDDKWMRCGLELTELQIDEAAKRTNAQIKREVKFQGRIAVTVILGTRVDCKPFVNQSIGSVGGPVTTSSKVVKDEHVSHATKHVPIAECEPPVNKFSFQKAKGAAGDPISIIFRCRSPEFLKLLNIIEPTTSAALPSSSTAAVIRGCNGNAGFPFNATHGGLEDDDEDLPPKLAKTNMIAEDQTSEPSSKRQRISPPSKAENARDDSNPASTMTAAAAKARAPSYVEKDGHRPTATIIKSEEDEVELLGARKKSQTQQDKAQLQSGSITAASSAEDQAQRDRKKDMKKNRLEQLKLERELMDMDE